MKFIADFHIHSKYSRAVSPLMDLENLDRWAEIKGIKVLGTGDFTHPKWFAEIKALPHPRFIMQYRLKQKEDYVQKYITSLRNVLLITLT